MTRKLFIALILGTIFRTGFTQEWGIIPVGVDSSTYTLYNSNDSVLLIAGAYESFNLTHLPGALSWNGVDLDTLDGYFNSTYSQTISELNGHYYFGSILSGFAFIFTSWSNGGWNTVPDTMNAVNGLTVTTTCVYHNKLYVIGDYALFGYFNSFNTFDGSKWETVGNRIKYIGLSRASIVYKDKLYIGGSGHIFDTTSYKNVVTWNDTVISDCSIDEENCTVMSFAIHNDTLYAASACGSIYYLANNTWHKMIQVMGQINALQSADGKLFVGGIFHEVQGQAVSNVFFMNGLKVDNMKGGVDGNVYDLELFRGKVFVAGNFKTAGSKTVNNIAFWDINVGSQSFPEKRNGLRIYPTEANDFITIQGLNMEGENEIKIYNHQGKQVLSSTSRFASEELINVSKFPAGFYIVTSQNNLEFVFGRFIKN